MTRSIQVVGMAGSLRDISYTRMAVDIALQGARDAGADTQLLDLRDFALPFCDGNQDESAYPPDVFRLRERITAAQGIVLGTPEYHASLSGVLKNTLDLMGFNEFEGKMVGLVGVSGGTMGATHALTSLRNIVRSLHAWAIPEQVSIAQAWRAFDETGVLNHERMAERLTDLGRQVTRFAALHEAGQQLGFLHEWEVSPKNPGAERPSQVHT